MRIRLPFAGLFTFLLLLAAYAGLAPQTTPLPINDKLLHLLTFFVLTLCFYWIIDTNRRRTLNFTLVTCTLCLGVGSEFLQALLPNDRAFDLLDLVANLVGSLAALGLCSWYHKRMLERKRLRKQYNAVPGDDAGDDLLDEEAGDLELGEGVDIHHREGGHEEGVVSTAGEADARPAATTLEQEVDNWDENAVDAWEEDDLGDVGVVSPSVAAGAGPAKDVENAKKRAD
ncbi:hypothetical protein B0T22DRAFT_181304 [Podospora appendiculata]|uniref:VanZ-like domain-containing protein n=1 Tax=Podospora appendiculata TaxID=314037 RepID=A0AAE0XC25_9PEZI|nr:hypothetical protein B0T22DRAFT_181304 [Podospora appendiculata]